MFRLPPRIHFLGNCPKVMIEFGSSGMYFEYRSLVCVSNIGNLKMMIEVASTSFYKAILLKLNK